MRLAIFDLDGTVLRGNSWRIYFWWIMRRRPVCAPVLLWALVCRLVRLMDGRGLRGASLRPLRGLNEAEVRALGEALVAERLRAEIRPVAREAIARSRAVGAELVLATGAFDFLARPLAAELGIRRVLCTRLAFTEDRRCLGEISGPELRGAAKAEAVASLPGDEPVDWALSTAFSDDLEDMPLFAMVGDAVWVRPAAKATGAVPHGLRVLDWDSRGAPSPWPEQSKGV